MGTLGVNPVLINNFAEICNHHRLFSDLLGDNLDILCSSRAIGLELIICIADEYMLNCSYRSEGFLINCSF